ncbi:DNA modification methylase [Patescibacteria group bacterium]|nr:DNA modification methylase [Patescibacteria group bacterium]MBU4512377.1 DNA modification methylase [Patescibacteria group bacterium]
MTYKDVINLYEKYKKVYKNNAYKYISKILQEAKKIHYRDFLKNPTPKKDHEQSWKPFKGNALERIIDYILKEKIEELGLKLINGKKIERTKPKNLSIELQTVKRNLSVDFGKFGFHIPDVDLIIYDPMDCKVIAVILSKSTMRERIAQSAYWKIRMKDYSLTKHIKVFLASPDEDGNFTEIKGMNKSRAIVEADLDGAYIMSETPIKESEKIKTFDKFIDELKKILK